MRAVVVLAVVGLVALVIAVLTGSTPLALVVIALALAGIIQLVRDWRAERTSSSARVAAAPAESFETRAAAPPGSSADEFTPDISTDPDGPSSDARVDHA